MILFKTINTLYFNAEAECNRCLCNFNPPVNYRNYIIWQIERIFCQLEMQRRKTRLKYIRLL